MIAASNIKMKPKRKISSFYHNGCAQRGAEIRLTDKKVKLNFSQENKRKKGKPGKKEKKKKGNPEKRKPGNKEVRKENAEKGNSEKKTTAESSFFFHTLKSWLNTLVLK